MSSLSQPPLMIFSPNDEPFGLLSNNAVVPFTVDSESYGSVTEYTFVNLFSDEEYRARMRSRYNRDPYPAAMELAYAKSESIYLDAATRALRVRLVRDRGALERLRRRFAGGRPINIGTDDENETRRLRRLYAELIAGGSETFYDSRYGFVPYDRIRSVVSGLSDRLAVDPATPDAPFSELEATYGSSPVSDRSSADAVIASLASLDEIVAVVKIKLRDKVFATTVDHFGRELLDAALNYLLEKRYPNVPAERYDDAKRQQLAKASPSELAAYRSQLVQLYRRGRLEPSIVNRVAIDAPAFPDSSDVTADAVESVSTVEISAPSLSAGDIEFLPDFTAPTEIDGTVYRTAVNYAYSQMFAAIGVRSDDFDSLNIGILAGEYSAAFARYTRSRLIENARRATDAKYADASLIALLLATNDARLVWNDRTDRVLGTGDDDGNETGRYLETLRERSRSIEATTGLPERDIVLSRNVVLTNWLRTRAADYANTLKLFRSRLATVDALASVYDVAPLPTDAASYPDRIVDILSEAGLDAAGVETVLPLIKSEFNRIVESGSGDFYASVRAMTESYDGSKPTSLTRRRAESFLGDAYDALGHERLREGLGRLTFVGTILSNQPVYDLNQEKWWRVNYWGSEDRSLRSVTSTISV